MIQIPIEAIPNQSFSATLESAQYELTLNETNGCMSVTVIRDNETILSGSRIVAGTPLIPYQYLESGNFFITTENDELPYYDQFGVTQFLVYVTASELANARA